MFQAPYSKRLEYFSTYHPRMDWHRRLKSALGEKGWSKAELSRRAGEPYDNVAKYLSGKVKQPRGDTLDRLARALDLDPLYLKEGVDADVHETEVPVVGYIGAGAEVEPDFEQVPPDGLEQVTVPFALPGDLVAFRVKGNSMLPQFRDGTVIIVYRDQRRALETFYGEEAAVRTVDGRRFIKTIMRGQKGVNLVSWNADPIEEVGLAWIGEIFAVLPPAALRRSTKSGGIHGQLKTSA